MTTKQQQLAKLESILTKLENANVSVTLNKIIKPAVTKEEYIKFDNKNNVGENNKEYKIIINNKEYLAIGDMFGDITSKDKKYIWRQTRRNQITKYNTKSSTTQIKIDNKNYIKEKKGSN